MRASTGEIEVYRAVPNGNRNLDSQAFVELYTIVIKIIDVAIGSLREPSERRASLCFLA